jgi:hypothetical protein
LSQHFLKQAGIAMRRLPHEAPQLGKPVGIKHAPSSRDDRTNITEHGADELLSVIIA